jgi:hypothetical protein
MNLKSTFVQNHCYWVVWGVVILSVAACSSSNKRLNDLVPKIDSIAIKNVTVIPMHEETT